MGAVVAAGVSLGGLAVITDDAAAQSYGLTCDVLLDSDEPLRVASRNNAPVRMAGGLSVAAAFPNEDADEQWTDSAPMVTANGFGWMVPIYDPGPQARAGVICVIGSRPTIVNGSSGPDTIFGGNGDDTINGGGGNDIIFGSRGNDVLIGKAGHDSLNGGDGDDILFGEGGKNGRNGLAPLGGDDTLNGNDGGDLLRGDAGGDLLNGNDGQDCLLGGDGADEIYGWNDADTIAGGAGDDYLAGNDANDTIFGGAGSDTIRGNDGLDNIWGDSDLFDRGTEYVVTFGLGSRVGRIEGPFQSMPLSSYSSNPLVTAGPILGPIRVHDDAFNHAGGTNYQEPVTQQSGGRYVPFRAEAGLPSEPAALGGIVLPMADERGGRVYPGRLVVAGCNLEGARFIDGAATSSLLAMVTSSTRRVVVDDIESLGIEGIVGLAQTAPMTTPWRPESLGDIEIPLVVQGAPAGAFLNWPGTRTLADHNDNIRGGDSDDLLYGEAGDDTIFGDHGDDRVSGEGDVAVRTLMNAAYVTEAGDLEPIGLESHYPAAAGSDKLSGNVDDDWIDGGPGADLLDGASGDDYVAGAGGLDRIKGGSDFDSCEPTGGFVDDCEIIL